MFSKVIKCLEQKLRKQIDCKNPLNTKQMKIVQHIRIEIWKYKAEESFEIQPRKVSTSSFCFSSFVLR